MCCLDTTGTLTAEAMKVIPHRQGFFHEYYPTAELSF